MRRSGTTILLPREAGLTARSRDAAVNVPAGLVYRASDHGHRARGMGGANKLTVRARIKKDYVGLARYRHLEDDDV